MTAAASAIAGWPRKQRRRRQHQIGAEHHQFAMGEIEHPADPVDQHVAAGDQGVDRGKDDDVDEELQAGLSLDRRSSAGTTRAKCGRAPSLRWAHAPCPQDGGG